jgi:hypothetical protein
VNGNLGVCPVHGKRLHRSRKQARQAAKRVHQRGRAYRCAHGEGGWHWGHLLYAVRRGWWTMPEHRAAA